MNWRMVMPMVHIVSMGIEFFMAAEEIFERGIFLAFLKFGDEWKP